MHIKHSRTVSRYSVLAMGAATVLGAFIVGMQTSDQIQPIALIEAGSGEIRGDIDSNGQITVEDAIVILEIVQGYREPQSSELLADPNRDGLLTVDDALRILATVAGH